MCESPSAPLLFSVHFERDNKLVWVLEAVVFLYCLILLRASYLEHINPQ